MTRSPTVLRSPKFIVPAILVAIGLSLVASGVDAAMISDRLSNLGSAAPFVFVVVGVLLMSMFVPKTIVSMAAGAIFGTGLGAGLMLVTAVSAAALNYSIGRWWLADSIDRRIAKHGGSSEILQTAQSMAADAGFGFHFLIRLAPIPTMVISYTMGACGARVVPFLMAAAVAVIPQSLWVHSGTAAGLIGDPQSGGLKWFSIALAVVGAMVVSIVVPREAMKRLRCQRAEAARRESNSQVPEPIGIVD